MSGGEVLYEKMGKIENDVKSLKYEYCNLEQRTTKLEDNYNKLDKNNAVRFNTIENNVKKTQDITIEIKHLLLKHEAKEEEKEKNKKDNSKFNITQLIAIIGILIAALALFKK